MRKKLLKYIKVFSIQLVIFLILGEVLCKFFFPIPKQKTSIHYGTCKVDSELGWITKENYSFQDSIKSMSGDSYFINYQSEKIGFREYGNENANRKKVLFIGDSFTQAAEVSNDKVFYNLIGDSLNIEVFAAGVSMYGTYQEYLLMNKFYNIIQPDLIIWQFCTNDFIDNYQPLEMECLYKSNLKRPYLVSGKTKYQSALSWVDQLKIKSNLAYAFSTVLNLKPKKYEGEKKIAEQGKKFKPYNESLKVTESIFKLINKTVNKTTPILAFNSFHHEPQNTHFIEICKNENINFSFNFTKELIAAGGPIKYLVNDGTHWNELGHSIVAKALIPDILKFL